MKAGTLLELLRALCLLGLSVGCGADSRSSGPENGGKTNWLSACERDSDCGTFECLANVCTLGCGSTSDCGRLGNAALCADVTGASSRVCVAECTSDDDCEAIGDGLRCDDDRCVAAGAEPCEGDDCPCDGSDCESPSPSEYEPCADKLCGDSCRECAPGDPNCEETEELKYCDADGDCHGSLEACPADDCAERDPDTCGDYGCSPLSADPTGQNSATDRATLGCAAGEQNCDDAITCALSPEGACWRFSNGCTPADFTQLSCGDVRCCEGDECTGEYDPCAGKSCGDDCNLCPPGATDCSETTIEKQCDAEGACRGAIVACPDTVCSDVAPDACDAAGCTPIMGTPAAGAAGNAEALGCMALETACDAAITCALDAAGACFRFNDACIPEDFDARSCSDVLCCAGDECDDTAGCDGPADCADDEYCHKPTCEAAGECRPSDEAGCDGNYEPVCGCDGMTYGNACGATVAGAGVESEGECTLPDDECPDGVIVDDQGGCLQDDAFCRELPDGRYCTGSAAPSCPEGYTPIDSCPEPAPWCYQYSESLACQVPNYTAVECEDISGSVIGDPGDGSLAELGCPDGRTVLGTVEGCTEPCYCCAAPVMP